MFLLPFVCPSVCLSVCLFIDVEVNHCFGLKLWNIVLGISIFAWYAMGWCSIKDEADKCHKVMFLPAEWNEKKNKKNEPSKISNRSIHIGLFILRWSERKWSKVNSIHVYHVMILHLHMQKWLWREKKWYIMKLCIVLLEETNSGNVFLLRNEIYVGNRVFPEWT